MKQCTRINVTFPEISQVVPIPKDDLFLCMRPILAAGQILGCLPTTGTIKLNAEKLPTSKPSCWIPFVIQTFAFGLRTIVTVGLLCVNFVLQSMADLFSTWRQVNGRLWSRKENPYMKWKFRGIFCLLFTIIFTENWMNTYRAIENRRQMYKNATLLAGLYEATDSLWNLSLPAPPVLLELYCFVEHKLMLYSVCVLSVFHICLVVAIDTKFQNLLDCIRVCSVIDWRAVRHDFIALASVVESVNRLMSVHLLYIMIDSLYHTTSLICRTINPEGRSWVDGIYMIMAISYLLMRFAFLCIPAGNIYGASQNVWTIVQQYPEREYDETAQRLERLASVPTGITCMGLFTITRSFILGFFNAAFAIVIFKLQAGNMSSS